MRRRGYEPAPEWDADAYAVAGSPGVAWVVLGWTTEPDEDTKWSGFEVRTGQLACCMVGDDHVSHLDPEDLRPLTDEDYCASCGQIGCGHS